MIGETPQKADAADVPTALDSVWPQAVADDSVVDVAPQAPHPREIGGRDGPDPTRYGDWEKNGRCVDF
jgi:hypothetical protein